MGLDIFVKIFSLFVSCSGFGPSVDVRQMPNDLMHAMHLKYPYLFPMVSMLILITLEVGIRLMSESKEELFCKGILKLKTSSFLRPLLRHNTVNNLQFITSLMMVNCLMFLWKFIASNIGNSQWSLYQYERESYTCPNFVGLNTVNNWNNELGLYYFMYIHNNLFFSTTDVWSQYVGLFFPVRGQCNKKIYVRNLLILVLS
jgi:hypothetical protein